MRGYIDSERVKRVIFWIITACLLTGVGCGILGVWEIVDQLQLNRFLTTLALVVTGSALFYLVNLAFGSTESVDDGSPVDSAFAERLRKAKDFRQQL